MHSLREWLTRKLRETRRGRAELILADRAAIWSIKPEIRHLPNVMEWARIRALTRAGDWTEAERRMMRRAGQFNGLRGIAFAGVAAILAIVGLNFWRRQVDAENARLASRLVQRLVTVDTKEVGTVSREMTNYHRWADPQLRQIIADPEYPPKAKLHASIALLPIDSTQADYLESRLRTATPAEVLVLRTELERHRSKLAPILWSALESAGSKDASVLPLAATLAAFRA